MNQEEKYLILNKAKTWFQNLATKHINNTITLKKASKFDINPFLAVYLSNFLTGQTQPEGIAKALIYPRVLGTSITTSFGTNMQKFTTEVLDSFGSTTSGIDIEFTDQTDGRKKYCQLKSGPNTINKDDVETITGHFRTVQNLARTNNAQIQRSNMMVGIIYGEADSQNAHYDSITKKHDYPVYIGQDFWHRLTGDDDFYTDLIHTIGTVSVNANFSQELQEVIQELSETPEIQTLSNPPESLNTAQTS